MLRAVQKGNAPTLIASLATDASAAFKSAAGTAGGVVSAGKADSKFVLYCEYQAAAMETVALAFTGRMRYPTCYARDLIHCLPNELGDLNRSSRSAGCGTCCSCDWPDMV